MGDRVNLTALAGRAVDVNLMLAGRTLRLLPGNNPVRRMLSQLRLLQALEGFKDSAAIAASIDTGLLDALADGPRTLGELAEETGVPEQNTLVLLDALTFLGLVARRGDTFNAEPLAQSLATGDDWNVLRAHLEVMRGSWAAWGELGEAARSGEGHPDLRVYNEANPLTGAYVRWSTAVLRGPSRELMRKLDLSDVQRMIAGTIGVTFAKAALEVNPRHRHHDLLPSPAHRGASRGARPLEGACTERGDREHR
ncbi:MAG: hypothetical protein M5U19_12810 [Microthrixaceae bacterium]|nr:hypothetical protein [Microthrixaceae bacterium]